MTDEKIALAKATPTLLGTVLYGLTLAEWVGIVTIIYTLLQIGLLLPRYWRMFKEWRK
jgi:hypothetical protein